MTIRIYHDPGHGGVNIGAVAGGVIEKHLTLAISRDVEYFVSHWPHIEQRQSRRNDESITYSERGDIAEAWGAHLVICHHADSSTDPSVSGMRCYHRAEDSVGRDVAAAIMRSAPDCLRRESWHPMGTSSGDWTKRAHAVLANYRSAPAVLIEWGFLSNSEDRAAMLDLLYRPAMGVAVLAGIVGLAAIRARSGQEEDGNGG